MTDLLPDMARPEPADPTGTSTAGPDYSWLVKPERVHGSLYTDPRIFADELARIWGGSTLIRASCSPAWPRTGRAWPILDPSSDRWRDT